MSHNTPGVGRSGVSSRIKQFENLSQTSEVQPRGKTSSKGKVESGPPPTPPPLVQEPPKPSVKQETFSKVSKETVLQNQSGSGSLEQVSQQVSQKPVERSTVRKRTSAPRGKTQSPPPKTTVQSTPPTPPPPKTTVQSTPPTPPPTTTLQSTAPTPPPPKTTVQSTPPTPPPTTTLQSTPPTPPPKTTVQSTPPTPPPPTTLQSTPLTPLQGSGSVSSVSTPTTLGPTDTGTLFSELKSEFPHLVSHFDSLAKQGVNVEVVKTDSSAGSGAYFNQETNTIRVKDDGKLSRAALKDNVLYESFNAVAEKQYKLLDKDLSVRKLSLPEYGDKKARAEAQVTINYVDTLLVGFKGDSKTEARSRLVELSRQVPVDLEAPGAREIQDRLNKEAAPLGLTEKALRATAWAERIVPGYLANPQPSQHKRLEDNFVKAPHEATVPSTHRFSLSSANLYSYEGLERQTAGGLIGLLQAPLKGLSSDQVTRIRNSISALRPALEQLDNMPQGTETEKNLKANAKAAAYENALQTLIRENPGFASKFQPLVLDQGIKTFAGIS